MSANNTNRFGLYGQQAFYALLEIESNERSKTKFVKVVESLIRGSHEYRQFISYLKREADLTFCSILNGLDEETTARISLEMHHYPFTLYDITETLLNRKIILNEKFTRLSLAHDVLNLHFLLKVGIIPLTKSMHEMAHSESILLDLDSVFGDYESFKTENWFYMSDPLKERYNRICEKVKDKEFVKGFNAIVLSLNKNLFLESSNNTEEKNVFSK